VICDYSSTTKHKFKALIGKGYDSIDKISKAKGTVSGCGSCDISILELLD